MRTWITWALFLVAFIYNILDVWQTKLLLSVGAIEVNPLMDYIINGYGIDSLFGVKVVLFLCLGMALLAHQIEFKKGNQHEKV